MNDLDLEPNRPNFFCYSLRKRDDWAAVVAQLLRSSKSKWQERNLGSHDIELSLSQPSISYGPHFCRVILLSPNENGDHQGSMFRVDGLLNQDNGKDSAIIFLLSEDDGEREHAYQTFTRLQMRVLESKSTTKVIPVTSPAQLPAVLETFQTSLMAGKATSHRQGAEMIDPARDILPYCTFTPSTPLPQQTTRILQENSFGFRDLVDQSRTDEGRERIERAIDEKGDVSGGGVSESEKVVSFWACEFTAL